MAGYTNMSFWSAARPVHAAVAIGALLLLSRTPVVGQACPADCSGDNVVAVNELVTCVGVVLGNAEPGVCPACDGNGDGTVNIADLIGGVGSLLNGCPGPVGTATPEVTETPEATETPTEVGTPTMTPVPTATVTPLDIAEPVAGSVAIIANGMGVVPSIVSAIATGITIGGGVGSEGAGAGADPCPLSGSVLVTGGIPPFPVPLTIMLSGCEVATATGSAVYDGAITLSGLLDLDVTAQVTTVFRNPLGEPTLTTAADVIGTARPSLGGSCFLTRAALTLSGTLASEPPDGQGVTVTLAGTDLDFGNVAFTPDCFPELYTLTLAGPAMLAATGIETASGANVVESLAVVFEGLSVAQDLSGNPAITSIDGDVSSECFGETVTLATVENLETPIGEGCPTSGILGLSAASGLNAVITHSGGMVSVDNDADGAIDQVFPSCFDPLLLVCPALL